MTRILASINLRFRPSDTLSGPCQSMDAFVQAAHAREMRPKTAKTLSVNWLSQDILRNLNSELGKMASSRLPSMRYASTLLITAALAAPGFARAADSSRRPADLSDSQKSA